MERSSILILLASCKDQLMTVRQGTLEAEPYERKNSQN
jgi:hypothetical protein